VLLFINTVFVSEFLAALSDASFSLSCLTSDHDSAHLECTLNPGRAPRGNVITAFIIQEGLSDYIQDSQE
jgi:hypothetical protein